MTIKRVVCTGIGFVSASGQTPSEIFDNYYRGQSTIQLMPLEESNGVPTVTGRIDFNPDNWFTKLQLSGVDRVSQMAVAAAEKARSDAGIDLDRPEKTGCYIGTGFGGGTTMEASFKQHFSERPRVSPLIIVGVINNSSAAHIAMRFKIHGPVLTYSIACASSAVSIGEACTAIKNGKIDIAIAGGTESLLTPGIIRAWQAMRTLAEPYEKDPSRSCRPFCTDRTGLVLAEGACVLILESKENAEKRNARIYCEIVGYGMSCDATHIVIPNQEGQVRAINAAIEEAGISPEDIGYINAHGTSTQVGDLVESKSIETVWSKGMDNLLVSSTKSMHGHLLGAAGATESALTALSLYYGKLLPTADCNNIDPAIKIPILCNQGIEAPDLEYAMNSSFAFGGTNAVLVFRKFK